MGYEFDFSALAGDAGLLLKGAAITLLLTAIASTLGIAISIGGAATSRWGMRWAKLLVAAYVELIRNTPFFVQLLFLFYGLPSIGIKMTAIQVAILAMTINLTAYCIEILRAGIEAVPPGQREAGFALGIGPISVFIYVVLPQAVANVYPALVSQIAITMLESAVVSQIAVTDLTHVSEMIQSRSYRAFETSFVVTLIYLVMCLGLRWMLARAGRRLFAGRAR